MADKPLFFYPGGLVAAQKIDLPEDTARHIGQVLRMNTGEAVQLTDGKGSLAECIITESGKKRVSVAIVSVEKQEPPAPKVVLGIAFTKNASRNEWLLEKATELGVSGIIPLITERSNKERVRADRWQAILISAMLQSKQSWLPALEAPTVLGHALKRPDSLIYMAHCMDTYAGVEARTPISKALKKGENALILIGPEGDFSAAEVILAEAAGAVTLSLGSNRLRTETAALAAITHFYLLNHAS